ncbi:MAG TPA: hypothetical protein VNL71_04210 [Chloroflexota bacterium]|nr:hypothetical protein [Chloroflexota bacterium]
MPSNRRARRARAARARHGRQSITAPRGALARVGLALAGLLCIAVALTVLLTPHGAHLARGFSFLLLLGGALVVAAWVV